MSNPVIVARDVHKSYRKKWFRFHPRKVLHGLNFEVATGEIWALAGSNGAGKSTFLRCLTGLLRPDSGHVELMSRPAFHKQGHPRLGYVPDLFATYPQLTVEESLRFYGALSGMQPDALAQRTAWALKRMHLENAAHERVSDLSKGVNQRLGLAQSLLHDPDLVVWDEPSSGLDPFGRTLVVDLVKDLKAAGKTVLFSTHILADIEQCCDHLAILVEGGLRAAGSIDSLKTAHQQNSVEALFATLAGPQPQTSRISS